MRNLSSLLISLGFLVAPAFLTSYNFGRQHTRPAKMNIDRVDLLVQYALAVASQNEDWKERELGPIHLLKYVYLADLAYAERNAGATYTGADWRFYNFGPWSSDVHGRIRPALATIPTLERRFGYSNDDGEGEGVRWKLNGPADKVISAIERTIPATIASRLGGFVRKFACDTSELLQFVYRTEPMLRAAPNEKLVFEHAVPVLEPAFETAKPLTEKQRKRLREAAREAREKLKARSAPRYVVPEPAPVYDEVFEEGMKALDRDAGQEIVEIEGEVHFDSEVWKSRARNERGAP